MKFPKLLIKSSGCSFSRLPRSFVTPSGGIIFKLRINQPLTPIKYSHHYFVFFALLISLSLHASDSSNSPKLGLQSWTCRNMTFEETVVFAKKQEIKQVAFFNKHLNPNDSEKLNLSKREFLQRHGIRAYSYYFSDTTLSKEENRKLFEMAKLFGMDLLVVEPKNFAQWDNLEALAREYDIKLAIHNHGIDSPYGDPSTINKILAERDRRIGVCLDVGWVTAAGFDAAQVFQNYGDRVFDIHFKDKTLTTIDGKQLFVDTEIGRGDTNFQGLFAEISKSGWSGVMAIETDSKDFANDPRQFVSKAKNYFNAQAGDNAAQ